MKWSNVYAWCNKSCNFDIVGMFGSMVTLDVAEWILDQYEEDLQKMREEVKGGVRRGRIIWKVPVRRKEQENFAG